MENIEIGIILRCDNLIKTNNFKKVSVNTKYGKVNRVYIGEIYGKKVAVLYGRFNKIRKPSWEINYKQNQMVFSELGVNTIIGTFIVGAISKKHNAGDIFVPSNYVGANGFYENLIEGKPFKNVDMYEPFCKNLRMKINNAADKISMPVKEGIYLSFTGYPRIETKSELEIYEKLGLDIVGQTLDAEATLARQMKCHYAAICALTDDVSIREDFTSNSSNSRKKGNQYIIDGRKKMESIITKVIEEFSIIEDSCTYSYSSEINLFNYEMT